MCLVGVALGGVYSWIKWAEIVWFRFLLYIAYIRVLEGKKMRGNVQIFELDTTIPRADYLYALVIRELVGPASGRKRRRLDLSRVGVVMGVFDSPSKPFFPSQASISAKHAPLEVSSCLFLSFVSPRHWRTLGSNYP